MNSFLEWGSSWLNTDLGIFYGVQVIRILCLAATIYFSSNGLLFCKKGWNQENKKELTKGISLVLCATILFAGFFRTLFY